MVRYGDRNFINNIENYWLFTHPDVAKRQSQDNLHWMARRLHTFIGNVKSRWARIHALLEMGFERFLDPDKEWSNDSLELIALVELGKKYSNPLGRHPGKATPVQFLGNLLGLFGLKLKSRKDSEGKRWYRLKEEVINDPIRQQVLTCVETKLAQPKEKIDWESAINEAHGVLAENQLQTQTEQALEGTAPSPQILYTNQVEGAVNKLGLESQADKQVLEAAAVQKSGMCCEIFPDKSEVITAPGDYQATEPNSVPGLAQALEFCDSVNDVVLVTEDYQPEQVEEAIALQNSQPKRQQLQRWYEAACSSQGWHDKIGAYGELLIDGISYGLEALKALLQPWSEEERWASILHLEEVAPEKDGCIAGDRAKLG